jgi:deazaflavin-dependent oxidoreductase (nitroreductase family)
VKLLIECQDFLTLYQDTSLGALVEGQSRRRFLGVLLGKLVQLPAIGPWLARASRSPIRLKPVSTRITRLHAWLLRRSGGRLRRSWLFAAGQPVLALTTTGRKTGLRRSTAVACFRDEKDLVLAGMNLGVPRNPNWALNLEANPESQIDIGGRTIAVVARRAVGKDAERLWQRWLELQPSAGAFREMAAREIPLFILTRRTTTDSPGVPRSIRNPRVRGSSA